MEFSVSRLLSPLDDRLPVLCQPLHTRRVEVDTVREEFTIRLQKGSLYKFFLDRFKTATGSFEFFGE